MFSKDERRAHSEAEVSFSPYLSGAENLSEAPLGSSNSNGRTIGVKRVLGATFKGNQENGGGERKKRRVDSGDGEGEKEFTYEDPDHPLYKNLEPIMLEVYSYMLVMMWLSSSSGFTTKYLKGN